MELLLKPSFWAAMLSLATLEIALGIDNLIFQSIELNKMPDQQRNRARSIALAMSMLARPALLCLLVWFISLPYTLVWIGDHRVSTKGLTLVVGGLFLLWKSACEIREKLDQQPQHRRNAGAKISFEQAILQLVVLDVVCSFDSVIAALGMSGDLFTMLAALVLAVFVMMRFADPISRFIEPRPRLQLLAFSFLFVIGLVLLAEGIGLAVPRQYVYLVMGLALVFELPRRENLQSNKARSKSEGKVTPKLVFSLRKPRHSYAACAIASPMSESTSPWSTSHKAQPVCRSCQAIQAVDQGGMAFCFECGSLFDAQSRPSSADGGYKFLLGNSGLTQYAPAQAAGTVNDASLAPAGYYFSIDT